MFRINSILSFEFGNEFSRPNLAFAPSQFCSFTPFPSAVTAEEAAAKEGPCATALLLLVRMEKVECIPRSVPLLQIQRSWQ